MLAGSLRAAQQSIFFGFKAPLIGFLKNRQGSTSDTVSRFNVRSLGSSLQTNSTQPLTEAITVVHTKLDFSNCWEKISQNPQKTQKFEAPTGSLNW